MWIPTCKYITVHCERFKLIFFPYFFLIDFPWNIISVCSKEKRQHGGGGGKGKWNDLDDGSLDVE